MNRPLPSPSADLVERARAFRESGTAPAEPRSSATVLLLRDVRGGGIEVFMMRRAAHLGFAAGMHVFPGGVVDAHDIVDDDVAAGVRTAAIRETFEETGLLLATVGDPSSRLTRAMLDAERSALLAGTTTLADAVARLGVQARADALLPWARWITPEFEPRRYDTWFFVVAVAGFDGEPRHLDTAADGEADDAGWTTPSAALAAAARGDLPLLPPTEYTLTELSEFADVAAVFRAAATREVVAWLPDIELDAVPPTLVLKQAAR